MKNDAWTIEIDVSPLCSLRNWIVAMAFGLLLMVLGIGVFCALIYNMAVYALAVMVGLWAGFAALHSGSGPVLAFAVGFVAGAIIFGVAQWVWNSRQPKGLRYAVVALFVAPAVLTGYCATQQISTLIVSTPVWQFAEAIVGATAVGLTAFMRFTGDAPVRNWAVTRDSRI